MKAKQETIQLAVEAAKKQAELYRECNINSFYHQYKSTSKSDAAKAQKQIIQKLEAMVEK